jgi:hypothetical protein
MPDTAVAQLTERLTRPRATPRDALAAAIASLREEEERLQALEQAQDRCREEMAALHEAWRDAEAGLTALQGSYPATLAYGYVNSSNLEDDQTLAEAEASVEHRRAGYDHQVAIEQALASQISDVENRVQRAGINVTIALANLVCSSAEIAALLAELDAAWATIRGIRKAFDLITHRLHGQMPFHMLSHWQAAMPLDHRIINYPVEESHATAWTAALDALIAGEIDTPLPSSQRENPTPLPRLRRPA